MHACEGEAVCKLTNVKVRVRLDLWSVFFPLIESNPHLPSP